jgi:PAS domain-containing protein
MFELPPFIILHHDRQVVAVAAIASFMVSLAAVALSRKIIRDRRLVIAVNNMTQGLVMFDAAERMVVCNDRYREMYNLSPEVVKPGCTLREVIRHRIETGSLERDPEEYRDRLLSAMAEGKTISWIVESAGGRAISVINRPCGGGYWVGHARGYHGAAACRKRVRAYTDVPRYRHRERPRAAHRQGSARAPIRSDKPRGREVLWHIARRPDRKERLHHDALTDLPNRVAFTAHLSSTLEKAGKAKVDFAVLCIDLDRFKEVNDIFGHFRR